MKYKVSYCLIHGKYVSTLIGLSGENHSYMIPSDFGSFGMEYVVCRRPFVSCPPPEFDMSDEWVDSLVDPSEDELLMMDMDAEMLLSDFGVI